MKKFLNREEAGRVLAQQLQRYKNSSTTIVLALPRGGVPVAAQISQALNVRLDVFIVRKLGVPGQEELAFGAIASEKVIVFNEDIIKQLAISPAHIEKVIQKEQQELKRRRKMYQQEKPLPQLLQQTIILVDDGVATGASLQVAIKALREFKPAQIIVAVPVGEINIIKKIASQVDQVVCPLAVPHLNAVGAWYEDFAQVTDEEVQLLLNRNSVM